MPTPPARTDFLLFAALVGCSQPPPPPEAGPLQVATLSWPVTALALRLLDGTTAQARCHLPADMDPPDWQPTSAEVSAIVDADVIVANGAGYEAWLSTAALPATALIDTSASITILSGPETTHQHNGQTAHSHGGTEPHTWLDPATAARQAEALAEHLIIKMPDQHAILEKNRDGLVDELGQLDAELETTLQAVRDLRLATNHPFQAYIVDHHHRPIATFDLDPATVPGPEALAAVQAWAQQGNGVVLWEHPPTEAVKAALGPDLKHVHFDTIEDGGPDQRPDGTTRLRANLSRLQALSPKH